MGRQKLLIGFGFLKQTPQLKHTEGTAPGERAKSLIKLSKGICLEGLGEGDGKMVLHAI
jgi:hypothetical protein